MKMATHTTTRVSNHAVLLMTRYKNLKPKAVAKMIDRTFLKCSKGIVLKTKTGVLFPKLGIEFIRISHREIVVCTLIGKFNRNPSVQQLRDKGCTHIYNPEKDSYLPLEDFL